MMRRWIVLVMVAALALTACPDAAQAHAHKTRLYSGTTSQGGRAGFVILRREGRPFALRAMALELTLTCDVDETEQAWLAVALWLQPLEMPSHGIYLNEIDPSRAFAINGKIQAVHGSGTLSWAIPAFTTDQQLQTCSTGDAQTWNVDRTDPSSAPALTPPAHPLARRVLHVHGGRIEFYRVS